MNKPIKMLSCLIMVLLISRSFLAHSQELLKGELIKTYALTTPEHDIGVTFPMIFQTADKKCRIITRATNMSSVEAKLEPEKMACYARDGRSIELSVKGKLKTLYYKFNVYPQPNTVDFTVTENINY